MRLELRITDTEKIAKNVHNILIEGGKNAII